MNTVPNGFSQLLLACLDHSGIDPLALYGLEHVGAIRSVAPTARRPIDEWNQMMAAADAHLDGRDAALMMARFVRSFDIGPVGFFTTTCRTLQEAAEALAQFYPLLTDVYALKAIMVDGHLTSCMYPLSDKRSPYLVRFMFGAMCWHNRIVGRDPAMRFDAHFNFPAPSDALRPRYEETFGGELHFDAEVSMLVRPKGLERAIVSMGDQGVRESLRTQLMDQMNALGETPANLMQQVESLIKARLDQGEVRIEDIALAAGMSVRTLQTRMEGFGLNFRHLVDRIRHARALSHMADLQIPLVDVAAMLGFSSQSSFNRAFVRWTNMPPGEYRRLRVLGEAVHMRAQHARQMVTR